MQLDHQATGDLQLCVILVSGYLSGFGQGHVSSNLNVSTIESAQLCNNRFRKVLFIIGWNTWLYKYSWQCNMFLFSSRISSAPGASLTLSRRWQMTPGITIFWDLTPFNHFTPLILKHVVFLSSLLENSTSETSEDSNAFSEVSSCWWHFNNNIPLSPRLWHIASVVSLQVMAAAVYGAFCPAVASAIVGVRPRWQRAGTCWSK